MKAYFLKYRIVFFLLTLLVASSEYSCKVFRFSFNINNYIPEKKYLLDKVVIKGAPRDFDDPLFELVKQKPNQRFLGIARLKMWQFLIADKTEYTQNLEKKIAEQQAELKEKRKEFSLLDSTASRRKIKKLQNKIASVEEKIVKNQKDLDDFRAEIQGPVILDENQLIPTARDMKIYLADNGYMKANVEINLKQKKKKATVIFTVTPGKAYLFKNLTYQIFDRHIEEIIKKDSSEPIIYTGLQYSVEKIDAQREHLLRLMKNKGYYDFQLQYIRFKLDTTGGAVSVKTIILNPEGRDNHKIYKVGKVSVEPEYSFGDTTQKKSVSEDSIKFISNAFEVRPGVLRNFIFLNPGEPYSEKNFSFTHSRLYQLKNFDYVDITSKLDSMPYTDTGNIDFYVRLTPRKKRGIYSELELNRQEESDKTILNYYSTLYGISNSFLYRDVNIFRSAIQLETRLRGAVEIPFDTIHFFRPIYTQINYQAGFTASLSYPQLLTPFKKLPERWNWRQLTSSTSLNFNTVYENNSYYTRTILSGNLSYQWNKNIQRGALRGVPVRFFLVPAEISLVDAQSKPGFKIPDDPLIKNLFDRHIITDSRFTFILNNQPFGMVKKPHWVFIPALEAGGFSESLFDLISKAAKKVIDSNTIIGKNIYGIQYYNYLKIESDIRGYLPVLRRCNLAGRLVAGYGIPALGSQILPFEKRYYIGGSNSVRAFHSRDVGPGTYVPKTGVTIDKSGDIKLEGSAEFRFPIYGYFKGALFVDAGNVWLSKRDSLRPGAKFSNEFLKEFAIGPGAGLRFDMSLFVFRADFAIPFRDPSYTEDKRWVYRHYTKDDWGKKLNFQLAIGYPF